MTSRFFETSQTKLLVLVVCFLAVLHNITFLQQFISAYAASNDIWLKAVSVTLVHGCALLLVLSVVALPPLLKPLLILILPLSAAAAYFIDTYQIVIDSDMIANVLETDSAELGDLLDFRLIGYLFVLGVLPAYLVYKTRLTPESPRQTLSRRLWLVLVCLVTAGTALYLSSDFYASFLRTHKIVRYYTNPATPIYSLVKFTNNWLQESRPDSPTPVGTDAVIPESDPHRELVVLVVGETARADHFSLNGYPRATNPRLAGENLISFTNVASCGTSTSVSVPCMFAFSGRRDFDRKTSTFTENVLDVLKRAGIAILWRDNNSGSKGVADRVEYQNFRDPKVNPVCDAECRDVGMLAGLETWVDLHRNEDMLIVLHQMGSHGPAYFKRYPPEFEKFKPTCKSNQLEECTTEQVVNTYDNTILYTDYFLSRVIDWLQQRSHAYETSMLYFSDHGESLGESGIYLHGFPYAFAPVSQKHVPALLWSAVNNTDIDIPATRKYANSPLSHDNLFHTLLGIFEVKSQVYEKSKDILKYAHIYP